MAVDSACPTRMPLKRFRASFGGTASENAGLERCDVADLCFGCRKGGSLVGLRVRFGRVGEKRLPFLLKVREFLKERNGIQS